MSGATAAGRALAALVLASAAACARQPERGDEPAGQVAGADSGAGAAADTGAGPAGASAPDSGSDSTNSAARPAERSSPQSGGAARPAEQGVPVATPVRGTVRVVGSSPFTRVELRPEGGGPALTLAGDTAALRRAAALVVEARGVPSADGRELQVERFAVVAANGEPVLDGFLRRDGDGLALETATGRVRLGNPPAALRDQVGARVWIGGPPATGPNPYGVLVPAP